MRSIRLVASTLFLFLPSPSLAQIVPFDSNRWETEGATIMTMQYEGHDALLLKGARAVIKDDSLLNGIIEFDVAFSTQRGFSGVFWRMHGDSDREEFYFRPHQSGNPDANQYNPVLNGVAGWQLYYGPSYAAPIRYKHNEWMRVRIVFFDGSADIFVDSDEPVLSVRLKNEPRAGQFGISASNFAPAYFANFRYERLDRRPSMGTPSPESSAPSGAIVDWEVSEAVLDSVYGSDGNLPASSAGLSWRNVRSESTGILNLARYAQRSEGKNTVLLRSQLNEGSAGVRMLRFGYSDRVSVYLNGDLLYRGTNDYLSRDYRYLGTIGLFDSVPLRLRQGRNELVFAVSESFGGWGVLAAME